MMAKYSLATTLKIGPDRVKTITKHQTYKETLETFVSILKEILDDTLEDMNKTDEKDVDGIVLRDMYMYRLKAYKHWTENLQEINSCQNIK
jgi:hypothetical protein